MGRERYRAAGCLERVEALRVKVQGMTPAVQQPQGTIPRSDLPARDLFERHVSERDLSERDLFERDLSANCSSRCLVRRL